MSSKLVFARSINKKKSKNAREFVKFKAAARNNDSNENEQRNYEKLNENDNAISMTSEFELNSYLKLFN